MVWTMRNRSGRRRTEDWGRDVRKRIGLGGEEQVGRTEKGESGAVGQEHVLGPLEFSVSCCQMFF